MGPGASHLSAPLSGAAGLLPLPRRGRSSRPDSSPGTEEAAAPSGDETGRDAGAAPARTNAEAFGQSPLAGLLPGLGDGRDQAGQAPPGAERTDDPGQTGVPEQADGAAEAADADTVPASASSAQDGASRPDGRLSPGQKAQADKLKKRDQEVRAHEQAHLAAAGGYATGGASYSFQTGPDGRQYAVGGSVSLDASPVSGDPEATIQKAQTLRRAALAPAKPSAQDRAVAAQASSAEAQARTEQAQGQASGEDQNFTSRLPSSAGSRSASSPDTHSPGGEASAALEQDRDPATPSLEAAALPGGPVPAQVPGAAASGQTRDLTGTQEAARAVSPAAFEAGAVQTRALEPVEKPSESEEGREAKGRDSAQARAARAYARAGSGTGASSRGLARVA
jgi:hypothetical protein